MEIIFIRHAKAQDRELNIPDESRHIISKGKKRLSRHLLAMGHYFKPSAQASIALWCSPAVRTRETAALVAEAFQLAEPQIHDFIYTGDDLGLIAALKELPDEQTVLLVGHEPHLSRWIERLTNEAVVLKTSDIVAVTITDREQWQGEINWQVTAKNKR